MTRFNISIDYSGVRLVESPNENGHGRTGDIKKAETAKGSIKVNVSGRVVKLDKNSLIDYLNAECGYKILDKDTLFSKASEDVVVYSIFDQVLAKKVEEFNKSA